MKYLITVITILISVSAYSRVYKTTAGDIAGDVYKYDEDKVYIVKYKGPSPKVEVLHKDLSEEDKIFLAQTRPQMRKLEAYKDFDMSNKWFTPTITEEEIDFKIIYKHNAKENPQKSKALENRNRIFRSKNAEFELRADFNKYTEMDIRNLAEVFELTVKSIKNLDWHPYASLIFEYEDIPRRKGAPKAHSYELFNKGLRDTSIFTGGSIALGNQEAVTGNTLLGSYYICQINCGLNFKVLAHETTHMTMSGRDGCLSLMEGLAEFIGYGIGDAFAKNLKNDKNPDPEFEKWDYFDFDRMFLENKGKPLGKIKTLSRALTANGFDEIKTKNIEVNKVSWIKGVDIYNTMFCFYMYLYMNDQELLYTFLKEAIRPVRAYENWNMLMKEMEKQMKEGIKVAFKNTSGLRALEKKMTTFYKEAYNMDMKFH